MFTDLPMPALMLLVMGGVFLTAYVVINVTNAYVARFRAEKKDRELPPGLPGQLQRIADQAARVSAIPHSVPDHDVGTRK